MKKALLLLPVLAATASVSAQSSVTLFGLVDLGIQHGRASGEGSRNLTQMISGGSAGSRFGVRGQEDLGGGLSASFWLEAGVTADTGMGGSGNRNNQASGAIPAGGLMFNRRSTVSLAGAWGEIRVGRDFVPQFLHAGNIDPFLNNGVGGTVLVYAPVAAGMVQGGVSGPFVRASNSVAYFLPKGLAGFYGQAMYMLGENPSTGAETDDDGNGYGARFGYASGPVDVSLAAGRVRYSQTATTGSFETWNAGAQYNLGFVKLLGMYTRDKRDSISSIEGRGWLVGGVMPVGATEFKAQFSSYQVEGPGFASNREVKQLAVGFVHFLSKRTGLYGTVAKSRNSNWGAGAGVTMGGASIGSGVTNPRFSGIDLGIRHAF